MYIYYIKSSVLPMNCTLQGIFLDFNYLAMIFKAYYLVIW